MLELIYPISLAISLGLNLIFILFWIFRKKPDPNITFEEAFCILNSTIETQRPKFFKGLYSLSKKYAVLGADGKMAQPNDRIDEYAKKKKDLKTAIAKKIIRNLSIALRNKILVYYTEYGLVNYILTELDKEPELGGPVK